MFKNKILDTRARCLFLTILCIISLQEELILANKIYFLFLLFSSYFINKIEFKFKGVLLAISSLPILYIELILENFIFSKDYFINVIGILLIIRFSDLSTKSKLFSFSLISLIVSVVSLINSQDILSSFLSILILILTIFNLYLIHQKELLDLKIKNLIKILSISFLIVPIIFIVYIIFPRTEINLKILNTSKNSLGIPDEIALGSFESFANSSKKVFTLNTTKFEKDELYFRVKVFDYMTPEKTWIATNENVLLKKYKDELAVFGLNPENDQFDIILENHNKKWIPTLKNYKVSKGLNTYNYSFFNQTYKNYIEIEKKQIIQFTKFSQKNLLGNELKEFYTKLPNSISTDLVKWVEQNKKNKTDEEYLEFLINHFNKNDYYYNISPSVTAINDYSNFFFNSKEGYCEYYAGIFVILSRLANIPSRIVSGYYGGSTNNFGDFLEFYQRDAHAWVEVWDDNKGWLRYDPTVSIPPSKIRNTINQNFENINSNGKFASINFFRTVKNYFTYLDYVWTTSFIKYDKKSRDELIGKFSNDKLFLILLIFLPFLILNFIKLSKFLNKKYFIRLIFKLIILTFSKTEKIFSSDTPDEVFRKIKNNKKIEKFFDLYKKSIYCK